MSKGIDEVNRRLDGHFRDDDRRFGELKDVAVDNAHALGRIESTLTDHGDKLTGIDTKVQSTNGKVVQSEKDIVIIQDREDQQRKKIDFLGRAMIGVSGGVA